MKQGIFLTIEGNDGSGKTTVCLKICELLKEQGYDAVYTREPGGSVIAEQIRQILLNQSEEVMDARTEAMLFAASRRQHLVKRVIPALQEKKIVLCDRFVDSSLAYQGVGRDIGIEEVWQLNRFAIYDTMPTKTFFLKVSEETGRKRMEQRGEMNRLDNERSAFHQKVREGYEELIRRFPERITVIDAEQALDDVVKQTLNEVLKVLKAYE